ncbi:MULTISPECIES: hypothetical protein [unclassified Wolbachia]|nr:MULTISPECIES: hypothetical protein [unclassified Wolbachia]
MQAICLADGVIQVASSSCHPSPYDVIPVLDTGIQFSMQSHQRRLF